MPRLREIAPATPRKVQKWPEADVERLKELVAAGKSRGQISRSFGGKYSRNSVCGKVKRLGLTIASPDIKVLDIDGIKQMYERGHVPGTIAKVMNEDRRTILTALSEAGITVKRNVPSVHPMWSMNEDDRRQAFYEKFQEGWKGVQARLNGDRLIMGTRNPKPFREPRPKSKW